MIALVLLLCLVGLSGAVSREYDHVNHQEINSFAEFKAKYFTLDGERASTNLLVAFTTPECRDQINDNPVLRGSQRHAGGYAFVSATVTDAQSNFPIQMNNCAEVFYFPYNTPTNQPNARTVEYEDVVDFTRWVHDRMKVSNFKLKNSFNYPINVFWYDESKNPILQQQMEPGEESFIGTHLGHIFVARRSSGEGDAEWTEADPIVDWLSVKGKRYDINEYSTFCYLPFSFYLIYASIMLVLC